MDLYPKNSTTLRKLLAKRQNPYTQIFKSQQLSNSTNQPKTKVNLSNKVITSNSPNGKSSNSPTSAQKSKLFSKNLLNKRPFINPPKNPENPITIETESDDEDISYEKIEKKVKTSNGVPISRRSSFDEDKDGSEHSTTCENHSEGSPIPDRGDLPWSPLLSFKSSKDPGVLTLDEDEIQNSSTVFQSSENFFAFKKVQSLAERLGGSCLSDTYLPGGKYRLKCKLRHQWETTLNQLEHSWCPKCEPLLRKCKEFAKENNGDCLNERFDENIQFKCHKGHQWSSNHKNYSSKWCAECVQEEKEFLRKKCEEARNRREKLEQEYQQKLFEEARRKAFQGSQSCGHQEVPLGDILAYFQKVDLEVENLAKKETEKFMSQMGEDAKISFQQVLQVYKILFMPEDILQKYMSNLNQEMLKGEFRRLAKIIHPDKNNHPKAGNAFQKIYKVYEAVIGRFEGSQKI